MSDRIADRFGQHSIFMDVDAIDPGLDFVDVINEQLSTCAALVCVIGPSWVDARDADGRRRLDDPNDFVRLEVGAALERKVRVIPVLIDGARMPAAEQLPEPLAALARRQAVSVDHARFNQDIQVLLDALGRLLDAAPTPPSGQTVQPAQQPQPAPAQAAVVEGRRRTPMDVLLEYSKMPSFVVAPNIAQANLENALRRARVPQGDTPLALLDFTMMGNANDSLVFTETGIFGYHSLNGGHEHTAIPYSSLRHRTIQRAGIWLVKVGDDVLKLDGGVDLKQAIALLEALKACG